MHKLEDGIGCKPKHPFILKSLHHLADRGRRYLRNHPGNVRSRERSPVRQNG